MAVASKVVSKRSARTFMDEGMEKETYDSYNPRKTTSEPHNSRKPSKFGEVREVEVESTSSRSSLASQPDADISTSSSDRTEPCPIPADFNTVKSPYRESVHQLAGPLSSKLTGLEKSLSFPKDLDSYSMELSAGTYPTNFGVVVPGVYRSSYPEPRHYDSLKGLGLKTIM
jgi:tyrosine-protein phosphatase SIW14